MQTSSAAETEAAGARLAATLAPGDVVLVSGELGAGKTTLIRGACRALGIEGPVTSPTFTIGQRHAGGRTPVSHLDLFRLGEGTAASAEVPGLLDEYLTADAIAFVEWPDQALDLLTAGLDTGRRIVRVTIRHAGGDAREIEVG